MTPIRHTVRASLLALTVALVGILAPTVPAHVAAQRDDFRYDVAAIMVVNYFDAINAGDYRTAYSYLSPQLQRAQPYAQFVALFWNLDHEELNVDGVEYVGRNSVVSVRLSRFNTDGTAQYYVGTYTVRSGSSIYDSPIVAINLMVNRS